jgi:hypothetical protein
MAAKYRYYNTRGRQIPARASHWRQEFRHIRPTAAAASNTLMQRYQRSVVVARDSVWDMMPDAG